MLQVDSYVQDMTFHKSKKLEINNIFHFNLYKYIVLKEVLSRQVYKLR